MRYDRSRGYKQGFYTRLDESGGVPLDRANLSCLIPWSTGQYALMFRYRGYMEVSYMMGGYTERCLYINHNKSTRCCIWLDFQSSL